MLEGRTLYKDGDWNTLTLPFNLTAEQIAAGPLAGCTLMELDDDHSALSGSTLTLNFTTATSIEAGKPYLIKWESGSNIVNPVFNGVTIGNTIAQAVSFNGGQFIGTYSSVNLEGMDASKVWFVGAENTLYNPDDASTTLRAFRAYFILNDSENKVKEINLNFDDATSILPIDNRQLTIDNSVIYNVNGQRMNGLQKGINIIDGKKVLIK